MLHLNDEEKLPCLPWFGFIILTKLEIKETISIALLSTVHRRPRRDVNDLSFICIHRQEKWVSPSDCVNSVLRIGTDGTQATTCLTVSMSISFGEEHRTRRSMPPIDSGSSRFNLCWKNLQRRAWNSRYIHDKWCFSQFIKCERAWYTIALHSAN